MPRLSTAIRRRAYAIHPSVHELLASCREVDIARQDASWLRVLAAQKADGRKDVMSPSQAFRLKKPGIRLYTKLCRERSYGKPFDYLYGSKPFGGVEVACRPGVLIPRWETEAYTCYLAGKIILACENGLIAKEKPLRILDLCTGTGCIAILLHHLLWLRFPDLEILGVDVSSQAIQLAGENHRSNLKAGTLGPYARGSLKFEEHDILSPGFDSKVLNQHWDIIVSNPPYISPRAFNTVTSPSVRKFEPKHALVPRTHSLLSLNEEGPRDSSIGDAFYSRLIQIYTMARAQAALFEIADLEQAQRVVSTVIKMAPCSRVAIWRDQPDQTTGDREVLEGMGAGIPVRGHGHARAVMICPTDTWAALLR